MTTRQASALAAALQGTLLVAAPASANELLEQGAAAWQRRAEGHDGTVASRERIGEAIVAYETALQADRDNLEARVELLRALAFLGEYATSDRATRVAVFARGRALSEEGIDRLTAGFGGAARPKWNNGPARRSLAEHLTDRPEAVGVYLLGAYHWGLWGRYRGRFAAVRQGVAGRLRDYAAIAIALDPLYANAGPHRLLGRLHQEAPRVPFFTGWVDRRIALAELSTAVDLAPDDYLGRLFWIEAILELDRSRRDEAIESLRDLAGREPRPETLVEDLDALAKANALLRRIGS